ncbi:MAG: GNAT family N-acetyltransferase [Firmicutes bacterium]|nr:GNAT family N-acetyltransferase [Bacillota bacterium]
MKKVFDEIPYIDGENITIKKLTQNDAAALAEMAADKDVYRFLPTFLFERKYNDAATAIKKIYDECFANRESVILGIYLKENGDFCGLAELYGFNDGIHKISIGYRLAKKYWGRGIASETVRLMVGYLYSQTDTQIITASTMVENHASARVLEKNGFDMVVSAADEDWGYDIPTKADKWIR